MGQAKLRGTYEQRKAEGIARRELEKRELEKLRLQRLEEHKQRLAELPPAQRIRTGRAISLLAAGALGLMAIDAKDKP